MVLRTVAGRYAGELRDYSYQAGLAALQAGTAVRAGAPPSSPRPAPPSAAPLVGSGMKTAFPRKPRR